MQIPEQRQGAAFVERSIEIRNSEESIAKAAVRFNVNPKTLKQSSNGEGEKRTKDLPMGGP